MFACGGLGNGVKVLELDGLPWQRESLSANLTRAPDPATRPLSLHSDIAQQSHTPHKLRSCVPALVMAEENYKEYLAARVLTDSRPVCL